MTWPASSSLSLKFFFLEAVEKVFVGVGSMLFLFDQGVKSGMLGFQFLDNCLVHWCRSFQAECHRRVINHEIATFVSADLSARRGIAQRPVDQLSVFLRNVDCG